MNPQVAFSERQRKQTTVNAAMTMAMEIGSYLGPMVSHVVHVSPARSDEQDDGLEVVAVARGQDAIMVLLQKICERLDKLEFKVESVIEKKTHSAEGAMCWKCRKEGHIACDCPKAKSLQQPGAAVYTVVVQNDATIVKSLEASQLEYYIYGYQSARRGCFLYTHYVIDKRP